MILSKRLKKIIECYTKEKIVADIGTDHGYIPIYLIEENLCEKCYATDISKETIKKAKKNIELYEKKDKIETLIGDGLKVLEDKEVDVVVIAGMGGNLIRDIIKESNGVFKKLKYIICIPAQNPEVLRKFLYESGSTIISEDIVFDEIFYDVLVFKYGKDIKKLKDFEYEFPESFVTKKEGKEYFKSKKTNYLLIKEKLKQNENEKTILKLKTVEEKLKYIDSLIERC